RAIGSLEATEMNFPIRKSPARRGLTLMELVIVLVILVALAGIVIPLLPNMLTRAHTASAATNMQEVIKLIATYAQLTFAYPDGWDSLTDGANIVSYVPTTTNPAVLTTQPSNV